MKTKATESDTETDSTSCHAVFVDTSLNTHLVTTVSDSDTVSDLNKKLLHEHLLCFPNVGEIEIHSMTVRRKLYSYHLSESMLVKSAFAGLSDGWFISVDASKVEKDDQKLVEGTCNCCRLGGTRAERLLDGGDASLLPGPDEKKELVSNDMSPSEERSIGIELGGDNRYKVAPRVGDLLLDGGVREKDNQGCMENGDQEMESGGRQGDSVKGSGDALGNVSVEGVMEVESSSKRERKSKRKGRNDTNEINGSDEALTRNGVPGNMSGDRNVRGLEESNKILKDDSKSDPARKRSKSETGEDEGQLLRESQILAPGCSKEFSGPLVALENTSSEIEVAAHASFGGLSAKNDEGAHVHLGPPNCEKKKKKKKSLKHPNQDDDCNGTELQAETTAVTSGKNTSVCGEEDPGAESVFRDQAGEGIVPNQSTYSEKEKNSGPDEEVNNGTSLQDMSVIDACNIENGHESSKSTPVSAAKRKRRSKNENMDHHLQAQESNNRKHDSGVSEGENIVLGDHQNFGPGQTGAVEEQREPIQNVSPTTLQLEKDQTPPQERSDVRIQEIIVNTEMIDAKRTEDDDKSSRKRRKSKRTRNVLTGDLNSSATEVSPVEPHETVEEQVNGNVISEGENMVADDHEILGTDQTGTVEEQRETGQTVSPTISQLEESKPSPRLNPDVRTEVTVNSEIPAGNREENEKLLKKRKKSKRTRDLATGELDSSAAEQDSVPAYEISAAEPHKLVKDQHSDKKVNGNDSNMPSRGRKRAPHSGNVSTSLLATEGEINDVIQNVVESVKQIGETDVDTQNGDGKSRKKTKKKQSTDVKDVHGSEAESKDFNNKAVELSMDNLMGVDASHEMTKEINKEKTSSLNHLNEACSMHEEDNTKEVSNSFAIDVPREHGDAVNKTPLRSSRVEEGHSNMVTPLDYSINFNDYFVPSQANHQDVVATGELLVETTGRAKEINSDVKANKKRERTSKVPGSEVKARPCSKSDKLDGISEEVRAPIGVKVSGANAHAKKNREASTPSTSRLDGLKPTISRTIRANQNKSSEKSLRVGQKKGPGVDTGAVNSARPKKSLIGTSGTIFKDYSSGSSSGGAADYSDSDASTRTPSDNSFISDYSDGENNADFNPSQDGSYGSNRKGKASKRSAKPLASGVSLDRVLRSSTRYKKAKLTASQSQPEDDIELVPESQPIT